MCGSPQAQPLTPFQNPHVSHLSLYDMVGTPGVAADVSHMNTRAKVEVNARRRTRNGHEAPTRAPTTAASQFRPRRGLPWEASAPSD